MLSQHGKKTGELGHWLTNYIKDFDRYSVYYDHGDPESSVNVVKTKGFYGTDVTRKTQLAQVDLMIATSPDKEIAVLIELEEGGFSPKRILGDVFSVLMCNGFAVTSNREQQYFKIVPETSLIVAGIASSSARVFQIEHVIRPRLLEFTVPKDSITLQNVRFVWGQDLTSTIDELKSLIKEIIPSKKWEG